MTSTRASRDGVTLVELLVVLAVLGIALSVISLSAPSTAPASVGTLEQAIVERRRAATEFGTATTRQVKINGRTVMISALPDGRVLVDSLLPPALARARQ